MAAAAAAPRRPPPRARAALPLARPTPLGAPRRAGAALSSRLPPPRRAAPPAALLGATSEALAPLAAAADPLAALGTDFLLFLGATVLVVPVFKAAKQSPVLGYLFAGVVMGQLGLFRDMADIEKLSDLGVLFLLFEMGLELSLDKLKALAKYAFGLGSLQMLLCTGAFMAVALPPGEGLMTRILQLLGSPPALARISTVDEALVIAVALSLSSSAFVLQLLKERGELETKFGQATLGILLYQDIATVPFLVLLPVIAANSAAAAASGGDAVALSAAGELAAAGAGVAAAGGVESMSLIGQLAPTAFKTLGGLSLVLFGGRTVLRRAFTIAASANSSEVFIALCLLSVAGTSLLTAKLGFSDTLGAFVSGVLLAETNFRAQVEADIQPFRGLLLGLFFVTTGASLDVALAIREWPTVLGLLGGLLALKASLITAIGPAVGLTRAESIRTGFALSQGGEFAFVLLALAEELNLLPSELNRMLIIVVVLSMAATPLLTEAGRRVAEIVSAADGEALAAAAEGAGVDDPALICGFGEVGQAAANALEALGQPYVAFDMTVPRVQAAQAAGFNVLYGDGSRRKVLTASGVRAPRAIAVCYTARGRAVAAVEALRAAFPTTAILARAIDIRHAADLREAGATHVVDAEGEAGLAVGRRLALETGADAGTVDAVGAAMREDMARQAAAAAEAHMGQRGPTAEAKARAEEEKKAGPAVYRFDASGVEWPSSGLGGPGSLNSLGSLGGSLDSEDASPADPVSRGLATIVLAAMGSAPAATASDGEGEGGGARAAAGGGGDGDGNGSGGDAEGEGDGGSRTVLLQRDGESLSLPDGSAECPLPEDYYTGP
jgi:Kef-type K+ transport system membrane component KefB/Trk K+ transport system NAD-binding subunit